MDAGLRGLPRVLIWSGHPDYRWRDIAGNLVAVTWKA